MKFTPLDADFVAHVRAGGPDANGQTAERKISDGVGVPCRSCLCTVPKGEAYLIVAARPFDQLSPYAELGPIFLCEKNCTAWAGDGVPPILTTSSDYLVKAYSEDQRIIYGTGKVTPARDVARYAQGLLDLENVSFVDVRSAKNNCFQTRARRS